MSCIVAGASTYLRYTRGPVYVRALCPAIVREFPAGSRISPGIVAATLLTECHSHSWYCYTVLPGRVTRTLSLVDKAVDKGRHSSSVWRYSHVTNTEHFLTECVDHT